MRQKTPLYEQHLAAGARMVDFGGWDMPVNYGSQKDEHHAVRRAAGVFDVSHMTVVDLDGDRVRNFLRYLLANDVDKLKSPGKALYTCMLNETGGIIDDLIVYFLDDGHFRLIVNAATRVRDLDWIGRHAADFDVSVTEQQERIMLAVQGPDARRLAADCIDPAIRDAALELKPFSALATDGAFVARTGYTGEDGWEIVVPIASGRELWDALLAAGVAPCGLGARDTLRLEAAMNLYGTDMDETVSPLVSGLAWTVALTPADRDFIGRAALEAERERGASARFVGLLLEDRGVLRSHQAVRVAGDGDGEVTSGGYSPTLERSIGLARLPAGDEAEVVVDIRGRDARARIVPTPFVRNGEARIEL